MNCAKYIFGFTFILALSGCGKKPAEDPSHLTPNGRTAIDVDGDPVALLPTGAFAAGEIDSKAWFAAGRSGAKLVRLADAWLPLSESVGVTASKDVDRVTFVAFPGASAEFLGVARGRFDVEKFKSAAAEKRRLPDAWCASPTGCVLVSATYRGADLFTVASVGIAILSPKTALIGTEGGIHRSIDLLRDGASETPALAGEFLAAAQNTAPFAIAYEALPGSPAAAAIASLPDPPIGSNSLARLIGGKATAGFEDDRVRVQATLATASPESAEALVGELKKLLSLYSVAALVSALPRLTETHVEQSDGGGGSASSPSSKSQVRVNVAVDDGPLSRALSAVPMPH